MTAYMGKIDGHKNTEVRGVLAPLGEIAQECNVAFAKFNLIGGQCLKLVPPAPAFIPAPLLGLAALGCWVPPA